MKNAYSQVIAIVIMLLASLSVLAEQLTAVERRLLAIPEAEQKAVMVGVRGYIKLKHKQNVKPNMTIDELDRSIAIGMYTSMSQVKIAERLGWQAMADYHLAEGQAAYQFLMRKTTVEQFLQTEEPTAKLYDKVLVDVNIDQYKKDARKHTRLIEQLGKDIYQAAVLMAESAAKENAVN